tara:strand:- start:2732 stop:2932 length:201 start_codon:yes stop_codon:yes gene_type:complete
LSRLAGGPKVGAVIGTCARLGKASRKAKIKEMQVSFIARLFSIGFNFQFQPYYFYFGKIQTINFLK